MCLTDLSGSELVGLSSAIAVVLADGLSADEAGILGDFFSSIGSNLSLISDTLVKKSPSYNYK